MTTDSRTIRWFIQIPDSEISEYMKLGWFPAFRGGHHREEYGLYMEFCCSCGFHDEQPPRPEKGTQRAFKITEHASN